MYVAKSLRDMSQDVCSRASWYVPGFNNQSSRYLCNFTRCRWAYASTGLSILANTLQLIDNPNGSTLMEERSVISLHCTKGILYPHCTKRMTHRSAPISSQAPDNFTACRLFSRVNGPKLVTVMGAPLVPSCTPVSERYKHPNPFTPRPFPPLFSILPR